jgi:pantothenate kinase
MASMEQDRQDVSDLARQIYLEAGVANSQPLSTPRFMLGIAGYPAAGKTTTAQNLVDALNSISREVACAVPMDGFHHYNAQLEKLGLSALKGVPASFDATAFIELLNHLRHHDDLTIGAPAFDRAIEEPSPNAILVRPNHKIIVVEGNYLLLDESPWRQIRDILNQIWFVDSDFATIQPRLLERHIKGGRSPQAARLKMESTDLPNARLIEASRKNADRIIRPLIISENG